MKIVNIVPGFGGTFYCGNCLRDSVYTRSLRDSGHEAITLPIYLPLSVFESDKQIDSPVFYGAVNIYLKQNFKLFRHMPAWMERFFNSSGILKYAAKKAGSTRATGLEDMTISMLLGKDGQQKEELQQLIDFLKNHEQPDVVHLSNALLIGMAEEIREQVGVPVVCSLQDEDVWIDGMHENRRKELWDLMSEKAKDVDAFIAVSGYFADVMKAKMNIPDEKINVIHIGVDPSIYQVNIPAINPPVVGYLSRLNKENGFEIFVDAFIVLKKQKGFEHIKAKASGGKTGDDLRFIKKQMKKLEHMGFEKDFEIDDHFVQEELHEFFRSVSILSVPVPNGEAFGLYQLESMASGIPTVQPAIAAFPEIAKTSGGGVVYEPNNPLALAEKWKEVISDPELLNNLSKNGRAAVEKKFNHILLIEKVVQVYQTVVTNKVITMSDENQASSQIANL